MFASEEGDNGKNTSVEKNLAKFEVDPVIEDEDLVRAEAKDEGEDTWGECVGETRGDLGPLST